MKKAISIILVMALALSFSACGKNNEVAIVEYLIDQIGSVTLDSEYSIEEAKSKYSSLDEKNRSKVENYPVLEAAEAEFSKLVEEQQRLEEEKRIAEAQKVEPAPISVYSKNLKRNSIGTPEVYIQFTNDSNLTLEVFDFYVKCYNKYGEVVKGYGVYDVSECYYDSDLYSGGTTPSDWHWTLFGFDDAASFEVAISRYKLAGNTSVTIPEDQMVWY